MASWVELNTLALKPPVGRIRGHVLDESAMKKPTSGGLRDTDTNDPTATPTGPSSVSVATTATLVGTTPSAER
jgi:hypothetical protein